MINDDIYSLCFQILMSIFSFTVDDISLYSYTIFSPFSIPLYTRQESPRIIWCFWSFERRRFDKSLYFMLRKWRIDMRLKGVFMDMMV